MRHAMRQPPIRNANLIGVSVCSHSGEFAPAAADLRLPGRGMDLVVTRAYRSSLAGAVGAFVRGWSTNICRRVESVKGGLVYHDGTGSAHRFEQPKGGRFETPPGLYWVIELGQPGQYV